MHVIIKRLARGEAKRWKSSADAPASKRRDLTARHEAAHAVVAVRIGLPLTGLHIQQRVVHFSSGETSLVNGIASVDANALQHMDPTDRFMRLMLFSAAPILMEGATGSVDAENFCEHDIRALVGFVEALGLPKQQSRDVFDWAMNSAAHVLMQDDGDAWRLVSAELRLRRFLTPARVMGVIKDSDARRELRRSAVPARATRQ